MENIIIPVDFSKYAEYAVKTACHLAKKRNSTLILVHMLELPNGYSTNNTEYGKTTVFMLKYAELKMKKFLELSCLKGMKIKVIIKHFTLFPEIGELAKENNASLIVMGSHGVSEHDELFIGSNTEKVVRTSTIPVLVVKEELSIVDFSKSVFLSDFKPESIEAYKKAKTFFNLIDCEPTLLFINTPSNGFVSTEDMNKRLENFLMEADGNLNNMKLFENYDDYNVVKGVSYYTKQNNTSLISIATHGKTSFQNFFDHSISLEISNESSIPVLTILI